ncbi:MAG TPA: DUF952 domain-containing protein [Myxococcales bacterium]|nr:DUF952 domain-containing protein [Myxococcales bacterium]
MSLIYHLVPRSHLAARREGGSYVPARFEQDGFIHCTGELPALVKVANDYFAGVEEPLVVLVIDTGALRSRVVFEAPAPLPGAGTSHLEGATKFPHVYGPLNLDAVTAAGTLPRTHAGFQAPETLVPLAELMGD